MKILVGIIIGFLVALVWFAPYYHEYNRVRLEVQLCSVEWVEPCTFVAVPDSEVEFLEQMVNVKRGAL